MKRLIVFYSHSGNNEKLAFELKERLESDIIKISEVKKRKTISILLDFFLTRKSKLSNTNINIKDYDKVIFIAPIWGGKIATPIKTFLEIEKKNLKKYYFITLCNGETGQKEKMNSELSSIVQSEPMYVTELSVQNLLPDEMKNKIRHTFNFRVSKQDLQIFDKEIEAFIEMIEEKEG